ncbi:MAG: sulfotransferase [Steroidobacteraceae bacterium]
MVALHRHNAEVQGSLPPNRLLVFDVKEGWEPLCDFLNVPVPHTSFPHSNSREETASLMDSGNGKDTH